MSNDDRERWNRRYREGAYLGRTHPSAWLVESLARLPAPSDGARALDLACGRGRNALYLARQGWVVRAVDISAVALEALREAAEAEDLRVTCGEWDLEASPGDAAGITPDGPAQLALVIRYANLPLIRAMKDLLCPGGVLIAEMHRVTEQDVAGPGGTRFRVEPEELLAAACDLDILHAEDGHYGDPDGKTVALARLVAQRPG
jgi:SAM-dependent methyltransferase